MGAFARLEHEQSKAAQVVEVALGLDRSGAGVRGGESVDAGF